MTEPVDQGEKCELPPKQYEAINMAAVYRTLDSLLTPKASTRAYPFDMRDLIKEHDACSDPISMGFETDEYQFEQGPKEPQ